ncbi:helix-turn-helix domain-containing protein [Acinetobacter sp. WZC-1]|uniref:helix-turn-helix domain-containing protein n=1 Tax=Acinetobacter sp. WZC-1 TaxID=3459034 RepID=UPI00403DEA3B
MIFYSYYKRTGITLNDQAIFNFDDNIAYRSPEASQHSQTGQAKTQALDSGHIQQPLCGSALDTPFFLIKALVYIENNIVSKIHISDLEIASGVSEKTLYRSFKKKFKLSPMSYIKFYRLYHIRDELMNADNSANITDTAFKWGITHIGRLSGEYKFFFGEKPSDTLKRSNFHRDA